MPSGRVDLNQYLDNWAGGLAIARLVRRTDPRPYHARHRLIRRMTRSVVRPSQASITTSIRNLLTARKSPPRLHPIGHGTACQSSSYLRFSRRKKREMVVV